MFGENYLKLNQEGLFNMVSKKRRMRRMRRLITALIFIIFSAVLFINNSNQLLSSWTTLSYFQLDMIAWIGIIGSVIYTIWKVSGDEL